MKLTFILPALLVIGTLSSSAFAAPHDRYTKQEYKKVQLKRELKKTNQTKVIKYVPVKVVKRNVNNTAFVKVNVITYHPNLKFIKR
ncbi:hypothetical protein [Pseudoalteromonas sp. NZS37]|uniref:hypothetical protein n=1 Tax=Pseudoalteromonas sp. NZS37 TaxID=2792071 RepID=UPI0018CCB715|nr:hypothetical protein [Pseudoalteromonas sp. NZS37]MBG9991446.1 hypothetical protein [Pseudoalteromonas sp. NZS37]